MSENLNKEDATIGFSADEEVVIMTLPLKKYALNEQDGNALIYGKMRELTAHVMAMAGQVRTKKSHLGLIKTNGKPPIDLKVN